MALIRTEAKTPSVKGLISLWNYDTSGIGAVSGVGTATYNNTSTFFIGYVITGGSGTITADTTVNYRGVKADGTMGASSINTTFDATGYEGVMIYSGATGSHTFTYTDT